MTLENVLQKEDRSIKNETDKQMELWAWEYRDRPQGGYATAPIDGNLALVETGNYVNRKPTAQGKETRRQQSSRILISDEAQIMENTLRRASVMNNKAVRAVCLFYLYEKCLKTTAQHLGVSSSYAKQLKNVGFSLVMATLFNT